MSICISPRPRFAAFALGIVTAATVAFAALAQAPANAPEPSPFPPPQPAVSAPAAPSMSAPAMDAAQTPPSAAELTTPSAGAASAPPAPATVAAAILPSDLSPWGMFLNADIVVKIVMLGLVFASLVTWTVFVAKNWEMWAASREARAGLAVLNEARSLAEANTHLCNGNDVVSRLLRTAVHEVQATPNPDPEGLKERVAWLLNRVEASASRRTGRGMGLLATIGATAPFVGLFGTVWGIMNSFIGISNAHTTNLAVVAPGIAEALLATALGLFAAIPAVVIYNVFTRAIGGYRALLADGSALVMRLVSRDCDRVSVSLSRAAAE
jgi:biopolymer transport protein ExbB